jgi:hypothetical protein
LLRSRSICRVSADQGNEPRRKPDVRRVTLLAFRARAARDHDIGDEGVFMSIARSPPACSRTCWGAERQHATVLAMRSQYSASSMKWVVTMIVTPFRARRSRQNARRAMVDAAGRLVEEEDVGFVQQARRHRQSLLRTRPEGCRSPRPVRGRTA